MMTLIIIAAGFSMSCQASFVFCLLYFCDRISGVDRINAIDQIMFCGERLGAFDSPSSIAVRRNACLDLSVMRG